MTAVHPRGRGEHQPQNRFFRADYQAPDWMFAPAASIPAVVAILRLPDDQLVLLRRLVDLSETRYPGEAGRFRFQRPTIRRRNRFDRLSME